MCEVYEAARHNLPWLEDTLWACAALSAALVLAGLAFWPAGRRGERGWRVTPREFAEHEDIDLGLDPPPLPPLTDGRSDRERELGAELVRRREAGERDGDLPRAIAEAEAAREGLKGGGG